MSTDHRLFITEIHTQITITYLRNWLCHTGSGSVGQCLNGKGTNWGHGGRKQHGACSFGHTHQLSQGRRSVTSMGNT